MPHVSESNRLSGAANAFAGSVTASEFRGAFANLATAVSIIATDGPKGIAGLTCSAVSAASDEPPLLVACIHGKSAANAAFRANGVVSVNCLGAGHTELSQAFAGVGRLPVEQRFALAAWDVLVTGAPCFRDALATFDCEIAEVRDIGTHSMFIAKVVATRARDSGEPLVYQRGAYAATRNL
jgi:flavin reductase